MDQEMWFVIQFSPKGADDWAVVSADKYDSWNTARSIMTGYRKTMANWDYRMLRYTLHEEVLKD